jgi:hypothetical protein
MGQGEPLEEVDMVVFKVQLLEDLVGVCGNVVEPELVSFVVYSEMSYWSAEGSD